MTSAAPASPPPTCEEIARDFAQRGRAAAAVTHQLHRLSEHQRTCVAGPYRVFRFAATHQLVVLRDVAAVDGASCEHECDSFPEALAWTNQRLTAELTAPTPRP